MSSFSEIYSQIGGIDSQFPRIKSFARMTDKGAVYFVAPSVALICKPDTDLSGIQEYLDEFPVSQYRRGYLNDPCIIVSGAAICKAAGQGCYLSHGKGHTSNENAQKYIDNIVSQEHLSVLEHAHYTFHVHGISRSLLCELTRHRHFSVSVQSQRYCGWDTLRWVKRPEFQDSQTLVDLSDRYIDLERARYADLEKSIISASKNASGKRGRIDKNQAARAVLSNQCETSLVLTGNVRTYMEAIKKRCSEHAEPEIRTLFSRILLCLHVVDPILFAEHYYSSCQLLFGAQ